MRASEYAFVDVTALASAFMASQAGSLQLAVAARLMRMDADMQASTVKLLDSANQSTNSLANVAAGIGTSVDITA
jgi:hypothetical protein